MGQCISNQNSTRRGGEHVERYNAEPNDTATLSPNDFPKLEFNTLLTKLKLKRCNFYRQLGIRIEFAGFEEFELKPKFLLNQTARWEIEHLLQFKATEFEMRKKFLVLSVLEDQGKVAGTIQINLYHLATGPYHQDFAFPLPKAPGARLSFNLKIAQMVKIKLNFNEVQMIPNDRQFPGDTFAFCLRTIIGDRVEESNLSYKYVIAFETEKTEKLALEKHKSAIQKIEKRQSMENNSNVPRTNQRSNSSRRSSTLRNLTEQMRQELNSRQIIWGLKISKQMPQISAYIPLYDLHCASFNVIFYSFSPKGRQFSSQCFISYNKLSNFAMKERMDSSNQLKWQDRDIQVQVKTYDHGKETGLARLNLTFTIQKFIKQMQICVRTENGVLQSSPVFGDSGGSSKIPEQLEQLQKLGNQIQNLFIEAARSNNNKSTTPYQGERYMQQVNKRLKKQKQILMSSAKQSKLMFVYQDERALLKGQRGLIELGNRTRALINEDKQQIAPNCWQLLIVLMKRGEMTLAYMGYTTSQVQQCLSGKANQFLKRKKEVSLTYHRMMVDLLHITLQALQTYNYESQKQFAELFCAYAYFRIPKFRNQVLTAITRTNDPDIEEWRGTQFSLKQNTNSDGQTEGQTAFSLMFDWENHFYKVLDGEEQYSKTQGKLSEMLRISDWQVRMRKRGGAFFAFVRYWVNYVEAITINSKHVSWRYFPGYNKILLSFLVQMKTKTIQEYSQAMRRAATSLLSNQKLLNPFILIIFRKTNCNDQLAVLRAFQLLHLFFGSIISRGRSLPSTFDLKLLLRGIKSVLEGDSAFAIGKVLLVIYDHHKLFPVQFRIQIALYLMTKVFFKIFLHWSLNVRTIFHHLFFIRIYHQASKPLIQLDPKDQQIYKANPQYRTEIISRYRKLIVILQNAQEYQNKIRTVKIDVYEKETHKKMKKKIMERRRQVDNPSLAPPNKRYGSQLQYQQQLMIELSQPKLQRYNSQVLSRNLKVAVQSSKAVKKDEVIIKIKKQSKDEEENEVKKRKLSFFQNSLQSQLVPLKQEQVIYVRPALQQFHKINEMFIQHIERNKQSVPVVKLQLSIDQKQLRPDGLSEHEQW